MPAAPYLTVEDAKERIARMGASGALSAYEDSDLEEMISEFEQVVEEYRGVAFTPRDVTEVVSVPRSTSRIRLRWPIVRAITSITIDGDVVEASRYRLTAGPGIVHYSAFRPPYPATIVYSHGFDAPTATLKRATALYVSLVVASERSGTGRDVLSQAFEGATTRYSTPNKAEGRPTGWLEVDRLLNSLPNYRTPGLL